MNEEEWRAFLLSGTRTAKLATRRSDGRPHVTPVWFILDFGDLVFTTNRDTVKAKNLHHDPRVMLVVDDEKPPFAFVQVEATAVIDEMSPEQLLSWTTRIAERYMGRASSDAYGRRNAVEGELLIRIPLRKVTARKGIAE